MAVDAARAKSLFLAVSDLADPAERAAFLDCECGGDAELRARVEALLSANDAAPLPAAGGATVDSAPGLPETEDYGDPTARVGAILAGKYKLVEAIGEGGMGSVFMAQQTEPVKRAVAVKVIKAGMDSKAVLARFEAERQALAMMDHPNIAKVLDAGTTDGGRPFFVMELVKGTPITRYCDEHKLTPRQRLELFVPVCQAIQHAHQKGIIHRDIKPSNVLVAMYDDRPVPKVIDFGVAKAAGQSLTDKTLMTGFGALVGTPEYMSPEQASLNNLDIDTRSDVYSLGVLLYELLTGTTPVDKKSLGKAALLEILRIVREVEAPRPSAKLSTIDTLPSVAANRGTEPVKLSKLMKGELDWLVMKALEKDRTRRYDTANGLARDIQRYLADEVVEARPPSVGYRVSKFARRYRTPLCVAGAFLLLLVLGAIVSTWQAIRATVAERAAKSSEEAAQERKRQADDARDLAEHRRDDLAALNNALRRANYVADMNLARVAWEEINLDRARKLIDKYRRPAEKDLRGFEWHYLNRLLHSDQLIIKAHDGWVTALAFTPDGKRLVSCGTRQPPRGTAFFKDAAREVKQWDAATGQPLRFPLKGLIDAIEEMTGSSARGGLFGMALSPDATRMAASCRDHAIRVWDFATGERVTLEGPAKYTPAGLDFGPDGKRLVSVYNLDDSSNISSQIRIWDLATRKPVVTLDGIPLIRYGPSFSPDGQHFAACDSSQGVVQVWNAATGHEVYSCKYEGGIVSRASFSPDGSRLAACGQNGVQVWDTATQRAVAAWRSDSSYGSGLAFSPNGRRLATGGIEGIVELWDTVTGQKLRTFKGHAGNVSSLAFSPDGTRLATGGADGTLRLWDTTGGRDIASILKLDSTLILPSLSPDGQTAFGRTLIGSSIKDIQLWNTRTGEPRGGPISRPEGWISHAWTADGKRLYLADGRKNVSVVDTATGKVIRTFAIDPETSDYAIALSPDEKWCAHSGPGGTIKIRNAHTGTEVRTIEAFDDVVHALVFSPDGSQLFAAGQGGALKMLEVATGREIATTKLGGIYIYGTAFSPDGKRLAVVGNLSRFLTGEVRILDAQNLREVWSLQGHTLNVLDVVFSPDGQRLATSSADRTVRLWDLTAGQEILKLSGLADVGSLRFVSDGRRLIGASRDGIHVWDATPLPPSSRP